MTEVGVMPGRARPPASDEGLAELHPVLRRLFAELEARELHWLMLRAPSAPSMPSGDVDLLVAPADAEALRDAAASLGFVALPGWETAPELILVSYDRWSDCWLVLDISTAVSFRGAGAILDRQTTEALLVRRRLCGAVAVPADDDAFWLLLLHCLLDKGEVAQHYRHRLRCLATATDPSPLITATDASPLITALRAVAGDRFVPGDFAAAARDGRWDALAELGRRLAADLGRRAPLTGRVRLVRSGIARRAPKPLLLPRRRGLNIALLGPNGVGKSTAAAGLQETFPFPSRVVYMGVWKRANRTRGRARSLWEIATRPLRIWSRYLLAQYHQLRGRLVIFDRYVYEALLPPRPPLKAAKRSYHSLLVHLIPRPRIVVVLDVAGHVAYGRKQENTPAELESERRLYAELGARIPALELVDAGADASRVRAEIAEIIWREMSARWRRGVLAP